MNIQANIMRYLLNSVTIHMSIHETVQAERRIRNTEFKTEFEKAAQELQAPEYPLEVCLYFTLSARILLTAPQYS